MSALQQGLAVAVCCAGGKHRSNAIAAILLYLMIRAYWNVRSFEICMLAHFEHGWGLCDRKGHFCEECKTPLDLCEDDIPKLHEAWELWVRAKKACFKL